MSNEIVQQAKSPMELVVAKMDAIKQVATQYLTAERAVKLLGVQMMKTPKLAQCTPHSILEGVVLSAQLGLEIGGPLGLFYLVPRKTSVKVGKNEWKDFLVAVPQIGYRGMIQILWRSGVVRHVDAVAVYKGDRFEVTQGSNPKIIHVPNVNAGELTDDDITHVYATIEYTNGGRQFRWMSRKQVERVRDKFSASYDRDKPGKGVWGEHFGAMALKTVVFRLAKYVPVTPQNQASIEVATAFEADEVPAVTVSDTGTALEAPKAAPVALPEVPETDDDGAAFIASLETVKEK